MLGTSASRRSTWCSTPIARSSCSPTSCLSPRSGARSFGTRFGARRTSWSKCCRRARPHTTAAEKLEWYRQYGVRECWLVDPGGARVTVVDFTGRHQTTHE